MGSPTCDARPLGREAWCGAQNSQTSQRNCDMFQVWGTPTQCIWDLIISQKHTYCLVVASAMSLDVEYLFLIDLVFSVYDCSAVSCLFGVFVREDELKSFYSAISSPFWKHLFNCIHVLQRSWENPVYEQANTEVIPSLFPLHVTSQVRDTHCCWSRSPCLITANSMSNHPAQTHCLIL